MTWQNIPGDTMFDFQDFYAGMAAGIPYNGRACEVGVADGKSAVFFLEHIRPEVKFFICDNLAYGGMEQFKTVVANIYKSGRQAQVDWRGMGISSLDASCKFPDAYFDFVYLDSSHEYEMTKAEIKLWWSKMRHNGILAGHDAIGIDGVTRAVNESLTDVHIENTANGHGVWWARKDGVTKLKL